MKWSRHKQQQQQYQKHEELRQLKTSDRPSKTTINDNKEEHNEEEEEGEEIQTQETLSAFAYASTPPPILKRQSQQKDGKWKNRLSLIRPASFLKLNNSTAIIN